MNEQQMHIREEVNKIEAIDFITYPDNDVVKKKYLPFALPALMDEMAENAQRSGGQSMAEIYSATSKLLRDKVIGIKVEGYLHDVIGDPASAMRIEKHSNLNGNTTSLEVILKIGLWYDFWTRGRLNLLQNSVYHLTTNLASQVNDAKSEGHFIPFTDPAQNK